MHAFGRFGHRHLHWRVGLISGASQAERESRIFWSAPSVPFRFRAWVDGVEQIVNSADLKCAHANIGQASAAEQPMLRGVL